MVFRLYNLIITLNTAFNFDVFTLFAHLAVSVKFVKKKWFFQLTITNIKINVALFIKLYNSKIISIEMWRCVFFKVCFLYIKAQTKNISSQNSIFDISNLSAKED